MNNWLSYAIELVERMIKLAEIAKAFGDDLRTGEEKAQFGGYRHTENKNTIHRATAALFVASAELASELARVVHCRTPVNQSDVHPLD